MAAKKSSLNRLLNNFTEAHKGDIKELTYGHLNENKLYFSNKSSQYRSWESSKKPSIWLNSRGCTDLGRRKSTDKNAAEMQDMMADFAFGPTGALWNKQDSLMAPSNTPFSPVKKASRITKIEKVEEEEYFEQSKRSPVCVEELHLPELRLPTTAPHTAPFNESDDPFTPTHEFIQTKHILPTKAAQYRRLKHLKRDVIEHEETAKRVVGTKSVQMAERMLQKKLASLQRHGVSSTTPSIHRLQAFSSCWEHLIEADETYGEMLRKAKSGYDRYIEALTERQQSSDKSISEALDELDIASDVSRRDVKLQEMEVKELEDRIREQLKENSRLRHQLREEEKKTEEELKQYTSELDEDTTSVSCILQVENLDEQVAMLHGQIDQQLCRIQQLKREQRANYVPIAVYRGLEQYLKETEVDIQKLCKQNEYLEKNIEELEEELDEVLVKTGVKEKDCRLLWKKVNTNNLKDVAGI